ncbi:hypothetical protein A3A79_05140 [Candidatus Gottesmanbacteria bacterium RIFCSPLOWO2_01_FULL_43_11b]|uniref:Uncharacterized protein n=1 Tax=Candidatus Gottesmanbacteria bacterium RIFCSPLOWO2_01_FULL_43_11b TaxID=1798392 RepID=A0A1F6AII5_9BACT|nr:MAG: hypothetical protein A3A79_05140 [Candidatus Gottesmanbacteria bacterium RIFCSPLOWO2_01_FULL_43_11b]
MKTIIFAGGVGTRLWPLSRKKSPKQFEKIIGNKSTLQLAAERLQPDFPWDTLYVSTGKAYVSTVADQLAKVPESHIIGEPEMRDVGPAVGLMTALLARESPNEPMAIIWSDHLVKNVELFRKILVNAGKIIEKKGDRIVFVAQKPRFASENLGWIEYGKEVIRENGTAFHEFVDFQYRPDPETAKKYYKSGHHAWNLGYFVTTPKFLWSLYERFVPNLAKGLKDIVKSEKFQQTLEKIYPTLEKISFDNAILESLNPKDALVISENIEWSDIGAWEALKEALENSTDKNVTQGKVMLTDTSDSLVYNYTNQTVTTIDVKGMLVVVTDDVVLVCPKGSVPKIKKFVESLSGTKNEHLV